QYDRALAEFNRALSIKPTDAFYLTNRASVHELMGDLKSAVEDYDRAIALEPGNPRPAKLKQAALAGVRGEHGQGQSPEPSSPPEQQVVVKHDAKSVTVSTFGPPTDVAAITRAAQAHLVRGDYDKAIAEAERAMAHEPRNAAFFVLRAIAFQQKREF